MKFFIKKHFIKTLIKVIFPLYITDNEIIDEVKMKQLINEIDYRLNNLIITEDFSYH